MGKFFKNFTLTWWQTGLFKLALISFGVIVGAYWADFFVNWYYLLWVLFVLPAVYLFYIWAKQ